MCSGNHVLEILVRCLTLTWLLTGLTGCAATDWANYNYGPGDWLNEHGLGQWDTMYNYQKFIEPEIRIHYTEDLSEACGNFGVEGCARTGSKVCDIWVGLKAKRSVLEHELRHCYGWGHGRVAYESWSSTSDTGKQLALLRARHWYPTEQQPSETVRPAIVR